MIAVLLTVQLKTTPVLCGGLYCNDTERAIDDKIIADWLGLDSLDTPDVVAKRYGINYNFGQIGPLNVLNR